MDNFERAMDDPQSIYNDPQAILADDTLSKKQKLQLLIQWEYDARELLVAEEENMQGDAPSMLNRVHEAIRELDPTYGTTNSSKRQ